MRQETKDLIKMTAPVFLLGAFAFYTMNLYDNLKAARNTEYQRAIAEQDDSYKVKCIEPRAEYNIKLEAHTAKYKLVFPSRAFDVLSQTVNAQNEDEHKDSTNLKMEKDLMESLCAEADAEKVDIKPAEDWVYFKAHWKELVI